MVCGTELTFVKVEIGDFLECAAGRTRSHQVGKERDMKQ